MKSTDILAIIGIAIAGAAVILGMLFLGYTAGFQAGVCHEKGGELISRTDICVVDGRIVK